MQEMSKEEIEKMFFFTKQADTNPLYSFFILYVMTTLYLSRYMSNSV